MNPKIGILNFVQAAVFIAAAVTLKDRWEPAALLALCGALFQLAGGVALVAKKPAIIARWGSVLTLVCAALLVGVVLHAGWHVSARFGSDARRIGQEAMMGCVVALPWVVAFPLWQVMTGRWGNEPSGNDSSGNDSSGNDDGPRHGTVALLLLLGIGLPLLRGVWTDRSVQTWPDQPALVETADKAHAAWHGAAVEFPQGAGPAAVLLTPWTDGQAGATIRGDGDNLGTAVQDALSRLEPPSASHSALVLDVARIQWQSGAVPVGEGGAMGPRGGVSPSYGWRPKRVFWRKVMPQWKVPALRLGKGHVRMKPTAFDSAIATGTGATALDGSWAEAPDLNADDVLASALAAAQMLARNQSKEGKYAYVVRGPSGKLGGGYNLPRHAGTTWFLARVAARTGDPTVQAATKAGMQWMKDIATTLPDGRAWVADNGRKDGKVWVGTTSLALLAAIEAKDPVADSWAHFIASSVDDEGRVRGEMRRKDRSFPEQKQNPYGQGQTLLALAAAHRTGIKGVEDALVRSAAFVDGPYGPAGANRLVTLDEHWACLAASAVKDALGEPAGMGLCRAYLTNMASRTPSAESTIVQGTGASGGLAEAVVAAAFLEPDAVWRARAYDFGQSFLDSVYRTADGPFLRRPETLLGGFRDSTFKLDVRMDAVQHVGSALLGIESLLRGERLSGSHP